MLVKAHNDSGPVLGQFLLFGTFCFKKRCLAKTVRLDNHYFHEIVSIGQYSVWYEISEDAVDAAVVANITVNE